MARTYLLLTILGIVLPYGALLPWVLEHGLNMTLLIKSITTNSISLMAWLDVIVAAVALLVFISVDGKQHQVKHRYLAVIGTFSVGVSCGLPLYLYLRTRTLYKKNNNNWG